MDLAVQKRQLTAGFLLAAALAGSVALRSSLDLPPRDPRREAATAISLTVPVSFGFEALLADWYWIRTLHYVGSRVIELGEFDLQQMPELRGLLQQTVTRDPQHLAAWRFGGFFLGQADPEEGLDFSRKGIRENPGEWRLVADQAFICWQAGRYREAARDWQLAAGLPGAPEWLQPMAAIVLVQGGEIETARTIFRHLIETSSDPFIREVGRIQIERLEALPYPPESRQKEWRR